MIQRMRLYYRERLCYSEIQYHYVRRGHVVQHARDIAQHAFPRLIGVTYKTYELYYTNGSRLLSNSFTLKWISCSRGFPNARRLLMAMLLIPCRGARINDAPRLVRISAGCCPTAFRGEKFSSATKSPARRVQRFLQRRNKMENGHRDKKRDANVGLFLS